MLAHSPTHLRTSTCLPSVYCRICCFAAGVSTLQGWHNRRTYGQDAQLGAPVRARGCGPDNSDPPHALRAVLQRHLLDLDSGPRHLEVSVVPRPLSVTCFVRPYSRECEPCHDHCLSPSHITSRKRSDNLAGLHTACQHEADASLAGTPANSDDLLYCCTAAVSCRTAASRDTMCVPSLLLWCRPGCARPPLFKASLRRLPGNNK